MALSTQEKELVLWGRENNKSTADIVRALGRLRQENLQPKGKTGVAGFALGAAKEVVGGLQDFGKLALAPLPGDSAELGFDDDIFEPKSEAERAGAKAAFVGEIATGASGLVRAGVRKFAPKGLVKFKNKHDDLAATIAPKTTGQQGQQLLREKRVVQGRTNPLTGKAKDVVLPDATLRRAQDVIEREIPDFSDSFKLSDDIETLTTKKAKELKPQLQSVKTTDEGREYLVSEWETLKELQKSSELWDDFPTSNAKFQNKFQGFVDEALEADNLDDLWDIRKRYDDIIRQTIKNPSPSASPSIQAKNEMWLQNRSILNDIIEGTADDLDVAVRGTWDDMSALYDARNNIISKARIDLKGKQGLINPRNSIKFLLGAGAGAAGTAIAF